MSVLADHTRGMPLPGDVYRVDQHQRCGLSPDATLYCEHCGQRFPHPLGDLDFVIGVVRAFARVHRRCRPRKQRQKEAHADVQAST